MSAFLSISFSAVLAAQSGPLQPPPEPVQNIVTPEKAVLGKMLFWEEQLSTDKSMACGTCHLPEKGFTDNRHGQTLGNDGADGGFDDIFSSPGVVRMNANSEYVPHEEFGMHPQLTPRRANDITGSLYQSEIFWDGRAGEEFLDPQTGAVLIPFGGALETQALVPIQSEVEMSHLGRDWPEIVAQIAEATPMRLASNLPADIVAALAIDPTYPDLFEAAFGDPAVTPARIAFALATYERTLVPNQTPWDDYVSGNLTALTPEQEDGWIQFQGIAGCIDCHTAPVFSDGAFHNNGIRHWRADKGRFAITGNQNELAAFKTPSLRNAGLRDRFFHGGTVVSLDQVGVVYLNGGGLFRGNLDPLLRNLNGVSGIDMDNIMDFVANGLTDPRVANQTFPFDRPTLWSEAHVFGDNRFGVETASAGSVAPVIIAPQPIWTGATSVRIALARAKGGGLAHFGLARNRGNGFILGSPSNLALPLVMELTNKLPGVGDDDGEWCVKLDFPNNPSLIGKVFHAQFWIEDPRNPGTPPAVTKGVSVEIQ
ncbi:MAG: cytochrome c peroxidase [Planctomycetota bacterium]